MARTRRRKRTLNKPFHKDFSTESSPKNLLDNEDVTSLKESYEKLSKEDLEWNIAHELLHAQVGTRAQDVITPLDEKEEVTSRKVEEKSTTKKPEEKHRSPHEDVFIHPRGDVVGLVEDYHDDPKPVYPINHYVPKARGEGPVVPRNWHPPRHVKDRPLPVGTLLLIVFLAGVFCLFVFSRFMAYRETRRAVSARPRGRLARRPRRPSEDEGGFDDDQRRRVAARVLNAEAPPRPPTPPPPYPGSPRASVYVNPLAKRGDNDVTDAARAASCASVNSGTSEEQPPPYPGN